MNLRVLESLWQLNFQPLIGVNNNSLNLNYNFITIEGNIGAGKTSLATRIAEQFNGKLILEQFEENAFLPKFYKDPEKYAFPLELSFLAARYHQLKQEITSGDLFKSFTISDYFIAKSLIFASKTLQDDEYELYKKLFTIINTTLPKPDLLVYLYLNIENLKRNISKRGREYEKDIDETYLQKIQSAYLHYIEKQHDSVVLIVDTNKIDFVNNGGDYEKILELISRKYSPGVYRLNIE